MVYLPPFEEIAGIHGHVCPGIAIGYRMCAAAAEWAGDEENIRVYSSTLRCPLDAMRTVFHLREHPDRLVVEDTHDLHFVLTKPDGSRLIIDEVPGSKISSPEADALKKKLHSGTASSDETARFRTLQAELVKTVFAVPENRLFTVKTA